MNNKLNNLCTVVVCSCDSYEDLWMPFFKILKKQWEDIPYNIVLNTESKSFGYEGLNIRTLNLYEPNAKVPWGKRLIDTLKKIDTKYVLILLEDFFLTEKVDQKRIEECLNWMENDEKIANFSFWRTRGKNIKSEKYPHFEKRPQDGEYRLNCQAATWRRERLISFIRPHESPWDWEILGSIRSRRYKDEFYSAIEGEPYIFNYSILKYGLIREKWSKDIDQVFSKHGIKIDYSIRGFHEDESSQKSNIFVRAMNKLRRMLVIINALI